jgi:hypothetical protein
MVAALRDELIEEATAPELTELRGIIVLGSNGNWVVAAAADEGESMLARPPLVVPSALLLAVPPAGCDTPFVVVDVALVMP